MRITSLKSKGLLKHFAAVIYTKITQIISNKEMPKWKLFLFSMFLHCSGGEKVLNKG